MLTVQTAARIAIEFIKEMYAERAVDIRLEEVQYDPEGEAWDVTVSFRVPDSSMSAVTQQLAGRENRLYKIVSINPNDGQVRGMSIRQLV